MKPGKPYHEISLDGNVDLSAEESRRFMLSIGVSGEIIYTPGHSEDSVTLILDEGIAFTGDLTHPMAVTEDSRSQVELGWAKIRTYGVKTIYPGHGPVQHVES
jgi:glyoxylase-like metal-dependent hydrolase (beta-lactamase superfamily II)